ncbi:hypothetical protein [Paracidovorax citrulli]|uniref:hypothetical protein n=1 Tax=Paracidovorax citrulli TaxID=80869 RepID=UPI003FA6E7CB
MATVLGISTDHAARMLRGVSGSKRVTGVFNIHLCEALALAGCKYEYRSVSGTASPLLPASEWALINRSKFEHMHVIIVFGRHYGTLLGQHYQCSLTRRVVPLEEIPQAHEKVVSYIAICELPAAVPRDEALHERARNARALARAKTLARDFGIVVDKVLGGGEYVVFSPELADDDPHDDRPNPCTGQEVLAMVEDYVYCLRYGYLEAVTDPSLFYPTLPTGAVDRPSPKARR